MSMKNRFKALGFIEVLIATVVVGIVSAVFLSMAGKAMKDLLQTERIETMGRIARDGANIAQEVANQQKSSLGFEKFFPDSKSCFLPIQEENNGEFSYYFFKDGGIFVSFDPTAREEIVNTISGFQEGYYMYSHYFLAMCIDDIDTDSSNWARVRFWVGDLGVKGEQTSDTDVKDFMFHSVISL